MSLLSSAINRVCLAVDMESYSRRDNVEQFREQTRLDMIIRAACAHARVDHDACLRQDSGDGVLLLLPPDIDLAQVVPDLLEGLRRSLSMDNRGSDATRRVRLRASMGQGTVHVGPTGFVGGAVVETCRVLNSGPLRWALRHAQERDLVVGVTDHFHQEVIRHGYPGIDPSAYRSLQLEIPERVYPATVWIDAPVPAPENGPVGADGPISGSAPTAGGHPASGGRMDGTAAGPSGPARWLRKGAMGAEAGFAAAEMLHHHTEQPPETRSAALDGTARGGDTDGHAPERSADTAHSSEPDILDSPHAPSDPYGPSHDTDDDPL